MRYLEQGNISLVREALKERDILRKNAPHLVSELPFIVPSYAWWEGPLYGLGLKLYQGLSGKYGFGSSKVLSRKQTLARLPNFRTDGLRGGVRACDLETGRGFTANAKAVVNATGPFTDTVRRLAEPGAPPMLTLSQGAHLVFDSTFLPGDAAIMVPHTSDGRVMFAIPWHGHTLVGTTDTPIESASLEPVPLEQEIEFILETAKRSRWPRSSRRHRNIRSPLPAAHRGPR